MSQLKQSLAAKLTSIAEVSDVEDSRCSGGVGCRQQDVLQSHTGVLTQSPVSNQQKTLRGIWTCGQSQHYVTHVKIVKWKQQV